MAKIFAFKEARQEKTAGIRTAYKLLDENVGAKLLGAQFMEYEANAKPKQVHYHQKRESAYLVLDGSATLMLNGVKHELRPNTFVLLSPGDRHGVVAVGEQGFKMIEFWTPRGPDRIDAQE